jgi:hypothetical protein
MSDTGLVAANASEPKDGLRQILVISARPNASGSHRQLGADRFQQKFETSPGLKIAVGWMEMQNAEHGRR